MSKKPICPSCNRSRDVDYWPGAKLARCQWCEWVFNVKPAPDRKDEEK